MALDAAGPYIHVGGGRWVNAHQVAAVEALPEKERIGAAAGSKTRISLPGGSHIFTAASASEVVHALAKALATGA